jgi:hypothetical protein
VRTSDIHQQPLLNSHSAPWLYVLVVCLSWATACLSARAYGAHKGTIAILESRDSATFLAISGLTTVLLVGSFARRIGPIAFVVGCLFTVDAFALFEAHNRDADSIWFAVALPCLLLCLLVSTLRKWDHEAGHFWLIPVLPGSAIFLTGCLYAVSPSVAQQASIAAWLDLLFLFPYSIIFFKRKPALDSRSNVRRSEN